MSQELKVRGLTCGHCVHAVTEELTALDGVSAVSVDLVPDGVSTVTVDATGALDAQQVRFALAEAGDYELV
ncbi:MAG: heavy-metal-associated domain-containing protein [Micrococcales bacterium]|nr:heavy-metal-associated domain-containing protein [Micrococcales bacterium]